MAKQEIADGDLQKAEKNLRKLAQFFNLRSDWEAGDECRQTLQDLGQHLGELAQSSAAILERHGVVVPRNPFERGLRQGDRRDVAAANFGPQRLDRTVEGLGGHGSSSGVPRTTGSNTTAGWTSVRSRLRRTRSSAKTSA